MTNVEDTTEPTTALTSAAVLSSSAKNTTNNVSAPVQHKSNTRRTRVFIIGTAPKNDPGLEGRRFRAEQQRALHHQTHHRHGAAELVSAIPKAHPSLTLGPAAITRATVRTYRTAHMPAAHPYCRAADRCGVVAGARTDVVGKRLSAKIRRSPRTPSPTRIVSWTWSDCGNDGAYTQHTNGGRRRAYLNARGTCAQQTE